MNVTQQFEKREKVYARYGDTFRPAIVQEVSWDNKRNSFIYYIKYLEQDNRLDRWVYGEDLQHRSGTGRAHHTTHVVTPNGVTTRRQSATGDHHSPVVSPASKGGGTGHHSNLKVSTVRARKDSSFFSRPKNIHSICMGLYEVETWYFSPYHIVRPSVQALFQSVAEGEDPGADPSKAEAEFPPSTGQQTLHICPYCVHPYLDHESILRHLETICPRRPAGHEIYRDPVRLLTVLEVDGKEEPTFCEHLALLSKLFLEHKALDHDMTPFVFYVLCSITSDGLEVLGYFSKEKQTPEMYNLSCILVLPQFQSKGIGRFLIELSYELSRREGKLGSPEKPLSDLGEQLYYGYWSECITMAIARAMEEGHTVCINYLVQATAITHADVINTLHRLNLLNGTQIFISEELIEKCYGRKLQREQNVSKFTFYSHLLSWSPEMYVEGKGGENNERDESGVELKPLFLELGAVMES